MIWGIASNTQVMALPGKYILPVFFLVLVLGAMILGPLLYFALAPIFPIPFHRAMDRALLLSALAAVALFWPRISLAKLWPLNSDAWKQLLLGYALAAVAVQAIIGFKLALDGFAISHTDKFMTHLFVAVFAALLVPILEETLFRGFIQTELIERLGWRAGWILAAAIFALAHFLKIPKELDQQPVHLWSGATALGAAFSNAGHGLSNLEDLGKAANLFLLGLILGGAFLRCGTLWLNAGLHSGLILALFLFHDFTWPTSHYFAFFGGDILSSPITSVVFILLGLWLWRFYRHPSILPETGPSAP